MTGRAVLNHNNIIGFLQILTTGIVFLCQGFALELTAYFFATTKALKTVPIELP